MIDELLQDAREHMEKSVDATRSKFGSVRTGRATPHLLDRINVDYYGAQTPLKQLATIHAAEARLLTIQPYDKSSIKAIEKAILESDVGLTPSNDGNVIRLVIPELTAERRKEIVRHLHKVTEDFRVSVRAHRHDSLELLKEMLKEKEITEDDSRRAKDKIEAITKENLERVDKLLKAKEEEVLSV